MSRPSPGALRQLDEQQAFEAMRAFLNAHWERGGKRSAELAELIEALSGSADSDPLDSVFWRDWRDVVAKYSDDTPRTFASTEEPTMEPRQMGFFSDWYVAVTWPNGKKRRVDGFKNEAHARGWIEHKSATWLANQKL